MSTLQTAAIKQLELCRLERNPSQDRLYVRLAYTYGITVPEIAEHADLSVETVQQMLVSG